MVKVHRLDAHPSCHAVDDVSLLHCRIHGRLRNDDTVLRESACDRLGHLGSRMHCCKIFLMSFHAAGSTLTRSDGRIIVEEIAVVMSTEVQLDQLGKLTESRRHVSIESETADVHKGHAAVRVKRYARLVTPEVRIPVEVPVTSRRIVLADISPLRAMKRLPYLIESIIVLDIFVRLIELYRDVSLSGLIVCNLKFSSHTVVYLDKAVVLVIHLIRLDLIFSCSQRKKRITLK